MTFNPLMAKVIYRNLKYLPDEPSVIELGNQRLTVSSEILDQILQSKNYDYRHVNIDKIKSFKEMSPEEMIDKTGEFYESLGFKEYNAIDLNSNFQSMVMDLNADLSDKYGFNKTFDVVTNNGTGEHLFNQYQVFKNIHNLTKVEGLMIHVLPFVNWLNHGFFNFHPILFFDLAATNHYEILEMSFATRDGTEVCVEVAEEGQIYKSDLNLNMGSPTSNKIKFRSLLPQNLKVPLYKIYSKLINLIERNLIKKISISEAVINIKSKNSRHKLNIAIDRLNQKHLNINIVTVMRKKKLENFKTPIQGKYSGENLETLELKKLYGNF